jgi:hypothetical protein
MIEISPYRHLAVLPMLAVTLALIGAAVIVLQLGAVRFPRRRLYFRAATLGLFCALASGAFWSSRHAGTGTQTAWGWPRVVYARWVSWEIEHRQEGIRWRGILANTVFYGAVAMLGSSIVVTARRGSASSAPTATDKDRGGAA